jgi:hypothetical protein
MGNLLSELRRADREKERSVYPAQCRLSCTRMPRAVRGPHMESLTYQQLGERLGCTPGAARALANRKRWPRTLGNDGKARVMAEIEDLNRPAPVPAPSALLERIEALQAELDEARRTGAVHRQDFELERTRCDHLVAEIIKVQADLTRTMAELMAERSRPWWRRLRRGRRAA